LACANHTESPIRRAEKRSVFRLAKTPVPGLVSSATAADIAKKKIAFYQVTLSDDWLTR
jgi:hypothetical protein